MTDPKPGAGKYLIIDEPFYRIGPGARVYLKDDHGAANAPQIGDVVRAKATAPDKEGDLLVEFNGLDFDIARETLLSVEAIIDAV